MKKQKSKLVRIMSENHPKNKFIPTIGEVREWFKVINREIFDNALDDFREIEIKRRHGVWAECWAFINTETGEKHSALSLNHYLKSKKHFIGVLAHEMIHHYQWTIAQTNMDHGETFFEWKSKLAKHKITLAINQKHPTH